MGAGPACRETDGLLDQKLNHRFMAQRPKRSLRILSEGFQSQLGEVGLPDALVLWPRTTMATHIREYDYDSLH